MQEKFPRGALVATLVGNTLEFYDFIIYSFLSLHIGRAFFPSENEFASLLLSVATFGVGFLTRPLGGVWIGAYADRRGRKPALLLTIALMSVGTLGLVVTPAYATIGIAAPVILVLSRLVQGLALGGEIGPASAVLLEAAPPHQRAIFMSLQSASQGVALLAGGLVGIITAAVLTEEQLGAWGWRIPFAVGLILIPVGLYMRGALPETLRERANTTAATALKGVWRNHSREIVLLTLVAAGNTIMTYICNYMTTYAQKTLGMPTLAAMVSPIAMGASVILMAPLGGALCERFGRRETLSVARVLNIVVLLPAFLLLQWQPTILSLVVMMVVLVLVGVPSTVAVYTLMAEVFPPETRAAGVSLTYALVVTIFGSTTQFVVTWLLGVTGDPLAPAYYGVATSIVALVAGEVFFRRRPVA